MEKEKALSTAVSQIRRSYGEGAIMKLGEAAAQREVSSIPTGALPLDLALGVGGIPKGRVMSQALRKLTAAISKSNCAVIFLNQLREKVGIMFGNPEVQPGGRALKFYASVRLDIRKVETIKSGLDSIGARAKVKVVKNKVAPPFRTAEFDILFNEGISREGALIDAAVEFGIIEKSGTWMSFGEMRLGQGRENVRNFLRENPTLAGDIEARVREKAAGQAAPLKTSTSVRTAAPVGADEEEEV